MAGDESRVPDETATADGPTGRGRTVTNVVSVVLVSTVSLVLTFVAVRALTRNAIDPPGTVYDDVVPYPLTIRCGLSDTSMQVQAIEAGGLTWYGDLVDHRLSPDTQHRGQLRITKVADLSLKTYRASDQAEFTSGNDPPIVFGPWRPICE